MYNSVKAQISYGKFSVQDMQRRIKKLYALGEFSEEQLDELFSLIAEKANPESERPEMQILVQKLFAMVEALSARVKALESGHSEGGTDEGDNEEYPSWEPWDGLNDKYQSGTIVSHNGQLWESVYSGQNVWEPGVVDERFWVKYVV